MKITNIITIIIIIITTLNQVIYIISIYHLRLLSSIQVLKHNLTQIIIVIIMENLVILKILLFFLQLLHHCQSQNIVITIVQQKVVAIVTQILQINKSTNIISELKQSVKHHIQQKQIAESIQ